MMAIPGKFQPISYFPWNSENGSGVSRNRLSHFLFFTENRSFGRAFPGFKDGFQDLFRKKEIDRGVFQIAMKIGGRPLRFRDYTEELPFCTRDCRFANAHSRNSESISCFSRETGDCQLHFRNVADDFRNVLGDALFPAENCYSPRESDLKVFILLGAGWVGHEAGTGGWYKKADSRFGSQLFLKSGGRLKEQQACYI